MGYGDRDDLRASGARNVNNCRFHFWLCAADGLIAEVYWDLAARDDVSTDLPD